MPTFRLYVSICACLIEEMLRNVFVRFCTEGPGAVKLVRVEEISSHRMRSVHKAGQIYCQRQGGGHRRLLPESRLWLGLR